MTFKTWRTGVHLQQDKVLAVSLTKEKSGWRLRRWWRIPLSPGIIQDGVIINLAQLETVLSPWSQMLPRQHRLFLAFPASRTLQKQFPGPATQLRESEQATWMVSALARELEMAPEKLCFDYTQDTFSRSCHVTAAQHNDVSALLTLAERLRLRLTAITPDASALANLLPFALAPAQCVAWQDETHWLWAMRHQWGRKMIAEAVSVNDLAAQLALHPEDIVHFTLNGPDPFSCVALSQPPLPTCGVDFTVALALAMGERNE
ncbi:DNA utilization protein HofM [Lelliottia sp. WAP21]|uniref:DNA utilization protein HofM n=1 Tax=Lelliottia sp. WAP21 TaxID=2877426 RepID=UPI001E2E8724|nr:DNA utilization protein HofM [Lelliottia sp. WAP21]